ncbi:MAG: tetratricopeptide repeat protein [Planctomycetota bacterium]
MILCLAVACAATEAERAAAARAEATRLTDRAALLFSEGEYEAALSTTEEALEENPHYLDAVLLNADCLVKLVNPGEAYKRLLAHAASPESRKTCVIHAARIALRLNQPSLAVVYLDLALEELPEDSELFMLRGEAELACGREGAAKESFQRSLELGGDRARIIPNLARSLYTLEEYEEAQRLLEAQRTAGELEAEGMVLLGAIQCKLGKAALGLGLFRQAAAMDPELTEAYFNQGLAHEALDDGKAAEEAYRYTLKIDPVYAPASHHLGVLLYHQGRKDEGLILIKAAIAQERDPKLKRALEDSRDNLLAKETKAEEGNP